MPVEVKICGLARAETVDAAVEAGAAYTGFVFYPPSPRNLAPAKAADLIARVSAGVRRVGLFVDPSDAEIDAVLAETALDIVQLHGSESAARVRAVKARTGLAVMKVVKLAQAGDLDAAAPYFAVADRLIFDAAAPPEMAGALPGGNALAFDWSLLAGAKVPLPWMLAGGLRPENLADAVAATGATAVDVSSGVEEKPGVKSVAKIRAFLAAASRL